MIEWRISRSPRSHEVSMTIARAEALPSRYAKFKTPEIWIDLSDHPFISVENEEIGTAADPHPAKSTVPSSFASTQPTPSASFDLACLRFRVTSCVVKEVSDISRSVSNRNRRYILSIVFPRSATEVGHLCLLPRPSLQVRLPLSPTRVTSASSIVCKARKA